MVHITAKLFWYRTREWWGNMADKLNDIVYTDDSKETVDVINLLLLGWILLGLIVYIIGTVIATQLRKRKATFSPNESELSDSSKPHPSEEHVSCAIQVKSSAPDILLEHQQLQKPFIIPTCSGDEPELVDWVNSVFSWIYKNRALSPVIDSWISALNARTRLLSTEHGILLDFKDVTFICGPPDIQEVMEICTSRGDLNVICELEMESANFEGTVTQVKEKDKTVTPFSLNLNRIYGKVNIDCNPEDLSFVAKFSEKPQIQLSCVTSKDYTTAEASSHVLDDVVCEICSEAFSSAILDLKFSCYPECPRLTLKNITSDEEVYESAATEEDEKLLVKIIKATDLGGNEGCVQPFCVVEMDEPPQKFETQALEEKMNPFWDESFTFTVKDASAELLFEIYDKGKPSKDNFLGLGIVSVEELSKSPSQRQIIPLQSRPLEDDQITGSLTTEFLFLNQISPVTESTHLAQHSFANDGRSIETNSRVTAGGTVITTTTIKRTAEESLCRRNRPLLAAPVIMPAHESYEDLLLRKKEQSVLLVSHDLKNPTFKKDSASENATEPVNKSPSNRHLLHADLTNGSMSENELFYEEPDQNSQSLTETLLSPQIACPSPLHVHDEANNSTAFNGDTELGKTDKNLSNIECFFETHNHTKLHEIVEPVIILNDSGPYNCDTSSTLPPIAEILENSSTASSKSLENDNDVEADLTGTALKELEKLHSKPNNSTSKSTLIIHSVQRAADSSVSGSLEASPASHLSKESPTSYSESVPSSPSQDKSGDDRSRSKEKKSLFGSLRRRLSFRKTRSKSAENRSESSNYSQGSSRSASSDRLRSKGQKPSPLKGKFMGMKFLAVPGSTRSSLSEVSGISGSSSRTYINENSTLVIETNENGIIKRYLIPNSLVHRSKWKKRGTKLHIYNDHVFVAKHLSGSTECKVCQKYLTRRPGKQGYECRGCYLQCHKSCHVKVENYCSNSSINSMEVEYIHDPIGATPKSI